MKKIALTMLAFLSAASMTLADDVMTNMPKNLQNSIYTARLCLTVIASSYAETTCEKSEDIAIAAKKSCNEIIGNAISELKSTPYKNALIDTSNPYQQNNLYNNITKFWDMEIKSEVVKARSKAKNCH